LISDKQNDLMPIH